ncbi:beta-mannosidase, partial [Rhizobium sp. Pop5]
DVHTALHRAGLIPDPYFGRNEEKVQWVAEREWAVERSFTLQEIEGDWYLELDYLDTVASVYVNGFLALEADNSFRRYRPDVSSMLKSGDNSIRIVFASNVAVAAARQKQQPFYIPYSTGNCPIPDGNMLRKPQCHFGWDWNIAIAPFGLYGTIALKKLETARIEHVVTRQVHNNDGSVDLTVTASLFSKHAGVAQVYFDLDGERVRLDVGVKGETDVNYLFHIDEPRLWWPSGSGEQALYTLSVEVADDEVTRQIGLRTIELITTPDSSGARFAFKVNGREIFCRGANWIPADALYSLSSPDKTEDLLQSAKAANMNMIRVWGGGFYEQDYFYDLCDRLGLLVWQDFMFACNLYPSTEDFLDNV